MHLPDARSQLRQRCAATHHRSPAAADPPGAGVDVNVKDNCGQTAVYWVALYVHDVGRS